MITEKDLVEAIAECQGERSPNANTCIKLAAYYTILRELRPAQETYSYAAEPPDNLIIYESESEFAQVINGRAADEIIPVMDELMTTLQVVNPRLYAGVMRRLEG